MPCQGHVNARDQSFTYDIGGNILSATGVGTYVYPAGTAPRPHAVIEIAGQPLTYDAVGNMLTGRGRTLTWDGANRPSSIAMGGTTVAFAYGPNNSRFVKTAPTARRILDGPPSCFHPIFMHSLPLMMRRRCSAVSNHRMLLLDAFWMWTQTLCGSRWPDRLPHHEEGHSPAMKRSGVHSAACA